MLSPFDYPCVKLPTRGLRRPWSLAGPNATKGGTVTMPGKIAVKCNPLSLQCCNTSLPFRVYPPEKEREKEISTRYRHSRDQICFPPCLRRILSFSSCGRLDFGEGGRRKSFFAFSRLQICVYAIVTTHFEEEEGKLFVRSKNSFHGSLKLHFLR